MSEVNTNESRRDFVKSGSLAAAGLVLTPMLVGCGEEEAPKKPRKNKNKGSGKPSGGNTTKPNNNNNTTKKASGNLVKNASELTNTGTVVLTALVDAAMAPVHFQKKDMNTNEPEAAAATDGKYPVDESKVFTNSTPAGGKFSVPNVVFELMPKDPATKVLAYESDALGVNEDFRFTRALVVGHKKKATFNIHDEVNHNVTVKKGASLIKANESHNGTPAGVPVTTKSLNEGVYNVTCSMHAWEKAYIYSFKHALFGVTGNELDGERQIMDHGKARTNDGVVKIENVEAGKYDVIVWMDGKKVGSPKEITVVAGENPAVNFSTF